MARPRARRRSPFQQIMGRRPRRSRPFSMPIDAHAVKALDRGALYHYWHPDREGVEPCPEDFARRVHELAGDTVRIVRPPAGAPLRCRCWLAWYRKPEVTHLLSPGWLLITAWHDGREPVPTPLPLDNRLLANLYLQSLKGGREVFGRDFDSAEEYFAHIAKTITDEYAKKDAARKALNLDYARDYFDSTRISNLGAGNKFALHHDGTLLPSRGEQNWQAERARTALPGSVLADQRERVVPKRKSDRD